MPTTLRARPHSSEYPPFYNTYVSVVPEGDVLSILRDGGRELHDAIMAVPEQRGGFRYAEGKWSIREVVGHIIDAERIFSYRALRFARGDAAPLAGFDENDYVRAAGSDQRTLASLGQELGVVRESTLQLFQSLPADAWVRRGNASGKDISVRALAYVIAGHAAYHLRLLHERYSVA